jgi:hypothetical protein
MKKAITLVFLYFMHALGLLQAQNRELRFNLDDSKEHYLKFMAVNQVWVRYTQHNPGSTVYGDPVKNTADLGIRRLRFQAFGQLTDRLFFYTQFGQNNLTYMQTRFTGAFFHDAVTEYTAIKEKLSIGAGLTGWSGLGRYASPAIGSVLSLDVPLYMQATNSTTDQFLRKLSVYTKGKIGKIDYRMAVSHPMTVQGSGLTDAYKLDSVAASFSPLYPKMQYQGYFQYQFLDQEGDVTPYTNGTYLGSKRIFNLGAGIIQQAKAMQWLQHGDTLLQDMRLMNVDVFAELPVAGKPGAAITFYGALSRYNMGHKHLRMVGVMNPANGNSLATGAAGNAFPMIGTGSIAYAQLAYLLPKLSNTSAAKLQVFGTCQHAKFEALQKSMTMYELGLNYYIHGTVLNKLSLEYQSRPVYTKSGGAYLQDGRKGMVVVQFQIGI